MSSAPDYAELQACAIDAARQAGSHALRNGHRRTEAVSVNRHDVKLTLDLECQAIAGDVVRARFPSHALLGEEDLAPAPDADSTYEWIIDPIDGTVNFSHGLPNWCCSIGVRHHGEVVAGAVYAPVSDELYTATANTAAACNGELLRVSDVAALDRAVILTGLDKNVSPELPPLELFARIARAVQRPRIMGSAALDICHVAAGRADGYFESGIYIWDIAAAALIVRQAGGKASILKQYGGNRLCFAATNGHLHAAFTTLLQIQNATETS